MTIDGEPWFVARDVASVLGYADTDYAIRAHCKGAQTYAGDSSGQVRHFKIIPERDVYRLVMRSKLPSAERFEEWVVGEVLPSIRKTARMSRRSPHCRTSAPRSPQHPSGTLLRRARNPENRRIDAERCRVRPVLCDAARY